MFYKHGTMYHSHSILDFDIVTAFFKKFEKTGFNTVKITCEAAQEVVYSKKYSPQDTWEDVFQHIRWDVVRVIKIDLFWKKDDSRCWLGLQIHNDDSGETVVWPSRDDRMIPGKVTPLSDLPHNINQILRKCWG